MKTVDDVIDLSDNRTPIISKALQIINAFKNHLTFIN